MGCKMDGEFRVAQDTTTRKLECSVVPADFYFKETGIRAMETQEQARGSDHVLAHLETAHVLARGVTEAGPSETRTGTAHALAH